MATTLENVGRRFGRSAALSGHLVVLLQLLRQRDARSSGGRRLASLSVPPASSSSSSPDKCALVSSIESASSSASPVDCDVPFEPGAKAAGRRAAVALLTLAELHKPSTAGLDARLLGGRR